MALIPGGWPALEDRFFARSALKIFAGSENYPAKVLQERVEPLNRAALRSSMTIRTLIAAGSLAALPANAATVLTNFPGPVTTSNLIKGTGGAIPNPIEYGFEFTVGGGDHELVTISLDIGTHLGAVPLSLELYSSASGPDSAVFLTGMTGPAQPVNQVAVYTAVIPTVLSDGETYFLRARVNGNASSYAINRTATAATGTWTMGNFYTRTDTAGSWTGGGGNPETMVEIVATPIPEPGPAMWGAGFLLTFLRRRRSGSAASRRWLPLGVVLLSATTAGAGTVVMDFDHLSATGPLNSIASPQNEDGLRITNSNDFYIFGPGSTRNTGHKAMANQFTNLMTTLTAQSGAKFTLVSMRLSPYSAGSDSTVTFTGNKAGGGTVTTSFNTTTAIGGVVRTFPATFQDVVSVTWNMTTGNTYHQFDDITAILPPEIRVDPPLTVTESSGNATVGVTLSEAVTFPVTLQWALAAGTATAGSDFTASPATGNLTIPAGQTAGSLTIPIINDTAMESLEDFTVSFSTTATNVIFAGAVNSSAVRIASEDGVTGFPGWMTAHGLTANNALPDADPNGDGVKNIETWLYRINPAGPSPTAWLDRRATFMIDTVNRPALRFIVPAPLPSDVRMTFEESTDLSTAWSVQAQRTGFDTGSLWTGTGSTRVSETNSISGRTITCAGSVSTRNRPRAFLRMRYDYVSGGGAE